MPDTITTDSVRSLDHPGAAHARDGMRAADGRNAMDGIRIDELVERALARFEGLPPQYDACRREIADLAARLAHGEIRLAVMGQFKRGKSSFINSLLAMDMLPVSVIPVTSIPTFIRDGRETSCVIRFFNKKPDLVARTSLEEIRHVLTEYISEERNPNNRKCVSEALIECDNPILKNGTVLIDTPGFGSTFVHNTKTTVDLVKGCDAVLFLLSADPPFTQTEVEFLKVMKRHVPRIFFILNKVDQITPDELALLDPFFKKILVKELGYAPDVTLFHASASAAAYGRAKLPAARDDGMDIVKREIIDFMVREKYFTLSQAVGDKFKTALDAAVALCAEESREFEAPLAASRQQHGWLKQHCDAVKTRCEREMSLIDAEIRALVDFVDKTLEKKKLELSAKAGESVRQIVASAIGLRANPLTAVKSSFGALSDEMLNHLFLQVYSSVAGPLKKAVELPFSQFVKTVEEVRRAVPSFSLEPSSLRELEKDIGIVPFTTNVKAVQAAAAFDAVRLPPFSAFRSKASVQRRCEEKLLPLAEQLLAEQFGHLSVHVKNSIRSICGACKEGLGHNFRLLHEAVLAAIASIEASSTASEAASREKIRLLKERSDAFLEIKGRLV
jgi:GTP-binding protein EngB required for normal cell division